MNGSLGKILICILCGASLLIAGCATPAPFGGGAPTPTEGGAMVSQAGTPTADLGTIISLLQSINERVSVVVENTRPEGKGTVTGNIVLFDTMGNAGNAITGGTSLVALPVGKCDVVVYAQSVGLFVTLEEEKDIESGRDRNYRNRQTCTDDPMCRRTVQLDDDFAFLYIEYKPYKSGDTLTQVTLSYRCR